jgi:ABC-type transporter Mla MlaB component
MQIAIQGPLERAYISCLLEQACSLLDETGPEVLLCKLSDVAADAVALDALARLALSAHRRGCSLMLSGDCAELRSLATFAGVAEAIGEWVTRPDAPAARTAGRSSRSPGRT